MYWFWVFLVGLIVGLIVKFFILGCDLGGFIIIVLIGIVGLVLVMWVGQNLLYIYGLDEFVGLIVLVIGVVVLLVFYYVVFKNKLF